MSYSDIYLNQNAKKVPTLILVIVISFLSLVLFKVFSKNVILSRATQKVLRQVTVVNLGENQAGIFWQTDKKEIGWVLFDEQNGNLKNVALDERDTTENKGSYLNHYVLLRNLKSDRDYFFKIVSNNQLVGDTGNKPFNVHTLGKVNQQADTPPAYGKAVTVNGQPLSSGVVILTFANTKPLLSVLKLSGEWLIPLNNIIDEKTNKLKNLTSTDVASINIYNENNQQTVIQATLANLSPLPQTTVLGKNYSFLTTEDVLAANAAINTPGQFSIIYPKENAIIPAWMPLIKGTAIPGKEVIITIHSTTSFSFRVTTDKNGIWSLSPVQKLPAGEHTLTAVTQNDKGEEVKLSRTFTIAKSGEQVLGNATPEPTLTGLPSPYPSTIFATATPASSPSPTILKSGFNPMPLAIISGSLFVVGLGIILAF